MPKWTDINTVIAVILAVFSVSTSWAGPWDDGFEAGKATCPRLPNCQEGDYDRGVEDGKNQCPACATCPNCQEGDYNRGYTDGRNSVTVPNCQEGDYNRGYTDGRNSVKIPDCQSDYNRGYTDGKDSVTIPDCQVNYNQGYTDGKNSVTIPDCQVNYNQGITDGKQQCREDPTVEGCEGLLKSDTQTPDGTKVTLAGIYEGKRLCREDPTVDGCEGLLKSDTQTPDGTKVTLAGINEGKRQCQNDPQFCGIAPYDPNAIITQAGIDEGKRQCQQNPSECIFDAPNENTIAAVQEYCNKETDFCGVIETHQSDIANLINKECPSKDNCGITLVTQQGKEAGKDECQNDPYSCFTPIGTVEGSIPDTYCDKKTKNCASLPHGKVYLPTIDYVIMDYTGRLKDVNMDLLAGKENILVLVLKDDYQPVDLAKLTIAVIGDGQVVSYPSGIVCGDDCEEDYEKNQSVKLFAVPNDSNSNFSGWSGDVDCDGETDNIIEVHMDADKNCTATFEARHQPQHNNIH